MLTYKRYVIEFKLFDGTTRSVPIEIPLGEPGGYYLPKVEVAGEWLTISFQPSNPDMPPVDAVKVELLKGYATLKFVEDTFQPKGNYLSAAELPAAVNSALAQAKASGAFDGKDGYTPIKGVDYFDGARGRPGTDGYTPIKGVDYVDGKDGVSPSVNVDSIDGGHRVSITDAKGTKAFDVMDGVGGSGGANIHVGPDAPTDGSNVWIDTDEEEPGGTGGGAQADWNAAEGEPGHILNRTHYVSQEIAVLIPEATYPVTECYSEDFEVELIPGKTYIFTWNGVDYERVAYIDPDDQIVIGSSEGWAYGFDGNEYDKENQDPFAAVCRDGMTNIGIDDASATSAVFSLKEKIVTVKKLPMIFLPDGYPYTEKVFIDPVFDGDLTGWESVDIGNGAYFVKVSSQYISVDDAIGSVAVVVMEGAETEVPITAEAVVDATNMLGVPGTMHVEMLFASFPTDVNAQGISFSAGTWFFCTPGFAYAKSLSCLQSGEVEIVHTIDSKYLPGGSGGGGGEFIINLTLADNVYSVDKTISEIDAAYNSGKTLICRYDNVMLRNIVAVPGAAYGFSGDIGGNVVQFVSATITNDGVFAFNKALLTQSDLPTELPNPKHIRFYNALYSNSSKPADNSSTNYTVGNVNYDGSAIIHIKGLQNPYALTVNGTSYDGSSAVDLTDVINAMIDAKLNG